MPIYEYECKSCGTRFEKVQPVTAEPLTVCVNCGQGPVRRVFHPVGVIFKGSGWYVTDSRKTSTPSQTKDSADKESKSTEKASGDGEAAAPEKASSTESAKPE